MAGLPGEALVREGLADCQAGRRTVAACLIGIAGPRLTRAGLISAARISRLAEPELELYRLLRQQGGDAYSRYNALLRELVSFESALDLQNRENRKRKGQKRKLGKRKIEIRKQKSQIPDFHF
jgi:hypothetical protein